MLTPIDVQAKIFKSGMGYSKADVDSFLTNLYADYGTLYRENMELKDKTNLLNESLNRYKDIEKSLQKALVLAETTSEETIASAKTNAAVIEQEARVKAEAIVADAKQELENIRSMTVELVQKYESYKSQYKALASAQMELLSSDAFNIELTKVDSLVVSEAPAAKPVYQEAAAQVAANAAKEAEDDMDETVSMEDDTMIKDIASIFEK
ncbi:DivIVA domain-containing protein [Frisingicoccus caecimuris]|uniref:Cell division initiation protein n=1 Tax=Frisingicoccus caecimuris TaxID=1796636 RepID=A0A4R2LCW3_9FIRM|nr:DivIVA domain-containing protein [Frisingicoccus caecimuris]MCR1918637.1 DivIVA domain-containing protein [Frisingicoccus caecimuris]TCO86269.1 cell division initiation protein [Frisingicoccus caecimuris]